MRLKEIKPGMVIHCKTEEEAELICDNRETCRGWKDFWNTYKERTCYKINNTGNLDTYGPIEAYEEEEIVEFSDLIIPELSAAEVPAILYEICKEYSSGGVNCNPDCPFAFHGMKCEQYKAENGQRVVEICEQWKADHEKKEPEFEWVDICRIIEVQDNGKKVCVHETALSPGIEGDYIPVTQTERILCEYISEHNGNYFATVEHVCRVKR